MTDDPKRWVDDESAPAAMRAFLRDARLDAPTLDDETRRRVRARIAPRRAPWIPIALAIAALAAMLALFFMRRVAPPIAVDPERDAGPPDAPSVLETIRLERTCGEEDVDYACTVHVETSRGYDRIELHEARGIAPPTCDGPRVAAEWITRATETSLTIESGASYDPQLAIRACAYEHGTLAATGTIEGTRRVPMLDARGAEEAAGTVSYDLRIALDDAVDDDAMAFAVVMQTHEGASDDGHPVSCAGDVVLEIPRAAALAFDARERVALPFRVAGATSRSATFVVCARDAAGALTTDATGDRLAYPTSVDAHVPRVLTPSGEIPLDTIEVGHRVVTRVRAEQRAWTTPGPTHLWLLDVVDRIDASSDATMHRLRLAGGAWATLPSFARPWSAEQDAFVAIGDLHVGEHVLTPDERELAIEEITDVTEDAYRSFGEPVLATPASYFLDGILVGGRSTRARTLAAGTMPSSVRALEVWPATADDCSVRATLDVDVDTLRARGTTAVAIAFAPHRGAAGTLQEVDCTTAEIGFEASLADLANAPADATGRRRVSVDMPAQRDDGASEIACDAAYAVTSCERGAEGLHGYAPGRWTMSGPACFAESTVVTTADGARAIATLRRGETIEAYDVGAHRSVRARIERIVSRGERPILALVLSSGAVLRVTREHPLFDGSSEVFRAAGSFAVGDVLRGEDGADVHVVHVGDGGRARVYDLSVGGPHTFVAEGVVVHNY